MWPVSFLQNCCSSLIFQTVKCQPVFNLSFLFSLLNYPVSVLMDNVGLQCCILKFINSFFTCACVCVCQVWKASWNYLAKQAADSEGRTPPATAADPRTHWRAAQRAQQYDHRYHLSIGHQVCCGCLGWSYEAQRACSWGWMCSDASPLPAKRVTQCYATRGTGAWRWVSVTTMLQQ